MHEQPAVRARGIGKRFGDVIALDGVDLDVAAGQIHGLVGPNGAGKTTLLGLLLHLALPDDGELEILGARASRALALPAGVAGFVDGPGLYPSLTARRNLAAQASLRGDDASRIDAVLDEVGLADVADDRVRGFSLGMRQRLGLAAAMLTEPRLLVLDEPANGLDPAGARQVHRVLRRLADGGAAIVLSSHRMDELAALCSDVTVLDVGRTVFSGPVRDLATEVGVLDYRLRTSDTTRTRSLAGHSPGVLVLPDDPMLQRQDSEAVLLRGELTALDGLLARLFADGVAVREFAPVVSPLEAAFLALTERSEERQPDRTGADEPPAAPAPEPERAALAHSGLSR